MRVTDMCVRYLSVAASFASILPMQSREKMVTGEMEFLNSQHKGMRAGGGLYIAHDPDSSSSYVR